MTKEKTYEALLEEARNLPEMTTDQKIEQRLDFAYGNLALSTNHRPKKEVFRILATTEYSWTSERFEKWAAGREWWDTLASDRVLALRARVAAGCSWDGVGGGHGNTTEPQEPEVRRILRECAARLDPKVPAPERCKAGFQYPSPSSPAKAFLVARCELTSHRSNRDGVTVHEGNGFMWTNESPCHIPDVEAEAKKAAPPSLFERTNSAEEIRAKMQEPIAPPAPEMAKREPCECLDADSTVTATMIECRRCGRVWGRCNGRWVLDPDTIPQAERTPIAPPAPEQTNVEEAKCECDHPVRFGHTPSCALHRSPVDFRQAAPPAPEQTGCAACADLADGMLAASPHTCNPAPEQQRCNGYFESYCGRKRCYLNDGCKLSGCPFRSHDDPPAPEQTAPERVTLAFSGDKWVNPDRVIEGGSFGIWARVDYVRADLEAASLDRINDQRDRIRELEASLNSTAERANAFAVEAEGYREALEKLVESLPKCSKHPGNPATRAWMRGDYRYCDEPECGANNGKGLARAPEYPRAVPLRAAVALLAKWRAK